MSAVGKKSAVLTKLLISHTFDFSTLIVDIMTYTGLQLLITL